MSWPWRDESTADSSKDDDSAGNYLDMSIVSQPAAAAGVSDVVQPSDDEVLSTETAEQPTTSTDSQTTGVTRFSCLFVNYLRQGGRDTRRV